MNRRKFFEPSLAATLLLPVLTGCVYLKKSTPPPAPLLAVAPTIEPPPLAPLYLTMSQDDPSLPELPTPPPPGAQPAPPPASVIVDTTKKPVHPGHHRGHKGEVEVAERESHEKDAHEHEAPATTTPAPDNAAPVTDAQNVKVTAPTPSGDTTASTPIGQLTAGPTQDAAGSKRQTADLIDTTERGVNGLHRNLNGDQVKTVAQIRSFLDQAQRAMHNGDVDGAYTLATKAKTLLDELTGAS